MTRWDHSHVHILLMRSLNLLLLLLEQFDLLLYCKLFHLGVVSDDSISMMAFDDDSHWSS